MLNRRRTKEDDDITTNEPIMVCTKCKIVELVMPGSRKSGLCNPCRENLTPKYLPDCQFDLYWEKKCEKIK